MSEKQNSGFFMLLQNPMRELGKIYHIIIMKIQVSASLILKYKNDLSLGNQTS